ncbi:MAG: 23S rRNA (adenine(2503)-C(2))-methyltransferase RlmN [Gemmatimonadota bacterium]
MKATRVDLKGLLPDQLRQLVAELGEKPYRADQIYAWVHDKGVGDITSMTDLPARFRDELAAVARIGQLQVVARQDSRTGEAVKFLFEVSAGMRVEAVLIREPERRTACLSSQVGCPLDCQFCATGRMGFRRNLTTGQIMDQLRHLSAAADERGERVTNVVMMGMGEPLMNYDNVVPALRLMRLEGGPAVGGRRITVSTAGYLPGIRRLAEDDLNVGLAISLNATTDETRSRLMPINRKYPIAELLRAADDYFRRRGRRVTFEYVLMEGVTDGEEDAGRLVELTREVPCKINLILYNELGSPAGQAAHGGQAFRRPPQERIRRFLQVVRSRSPHNVTLRESRGRDIDAACGQLYQNLADRPPRPRSPDPGDARAL